MVTIARQFRAAAQQEQTTRQIGQRARIDLEAVVAAASMSIATLFGIAVIGTVFWVASPEAAVALFASKQQWNPVVSRRWRRAGKPCR